MAFDINDLERPPQVPAILSWQNRVDDYMIARLPIPRLCP